MKPSGSPSGKGRAGSLALAGALVLGVWPLPDALAAPPPRPPPDGEYRDTITFTNGDRLCGRLAGVVDSTEIEWQHPHRNQSMRFPMDSIDQVILGAAPGPSADAADAGDAADASSIPAVVLLVDGDWLSGQLREVDDQVAVLDTTYGDTLRIRRVAIHSVLTGASLRQPMYRGPDQDDGWMIPGRHNRQPWQCIDHKLVATNTGDIALNLPFEGAVAVEFDVDWRRDPRFSVGLLAKPAVVAERPFLNLQCSVDGQTIVLRQETFRRQANILNTFTVPSIRQRQRARLGLLIGSPPKTITVQMDGRDLASVKVKDLASDGWQGLVFTSAQGAKLEIEEISIRPLIARNPRQDPRRRPSPETDTLLLSNKDTVSGQLLAVRDGQALLRIPTADLEIPVERVQMIRTGAASQKKSPATGPTVRAWFSTQDYVTFSLEQVEDEWLIVNSPSFGKARFRRAAFERLEFLSPTARSR